MRYRYIIMARWWNGHGYDTVRKEAGTKNQAIGAVKLLLTQTQMYQISITDIKNTPSGAQQTSLNTTEARPCR